jgi:signal transduction histidine kinase
VSTSTRARRFEFEGAERRVAGLLQMPVATRSQRRRLVVIAAAALLFAATFVARLAIHDPDALIANFYVVPIALLAIEFGALAGVLGTVVAVALVFAWSLVDTVDVTWLGYSARIAALLVTGALVGRFSERLHADIAKRQHAHRHLAMYADELERTNDHLGLTVEQLEAFAEIARAVGGETDLDRVLSVILHRGGEIVGARKLAAYLRQGDELVTVGSQPDVASRLAIQGSLAGEVLLSGAPRRITAPEQLRRLDPAATAVTTAILVPLVFRGETLGVLCAIDSTDGHPFVEEDEQLLMSVAASAATAIATARSVADARLRMSLEAAEQARAGWARELHDETLQGLTGARMVLTAGLARGELGALRAAAEMADEHLGDEMRKLRNLIAELRPASLDDLGLGPAIESLVNRQSAIGGFAVDIRLELDRHQRMARETEGVVYRIVQEALSNVVKHAAAERVRLQVSQLPDRVELTVDDDGRGFVPEQTNGGFGLLGMRERALLAGGSLSVSSRTGERTRVSAVLPLST